jgi:Zn ribbon nucleic-acid-binding protein
LLVAGAFVIPEIMRFHRLLTGLECPHCDQVAGGYFSRDSQIHLRCAKCGKNSPTDCTIPYAGGPPEKR